MRSPCFCQAARCWDANGLVHEASRAVVPPVPQLPSGSPSSYSSSCYFIFNLSSPNSVAICMKSSDKSLPPPSSTIQGGELEQPKHRGLAELPLPIGRGCCSRQGWPPESVAVCSCSRGECVHRDGVYPSSSLVFDASSLSISAAALSAICWICGNIAEV